MPEQIYIYIFSAFFFVEISIKNAGYYRTIKFTHPLSHEREEENCTQITVLRRDIFYSYTCTWIVELCRLLCIREFNAKIQCAPSYIATGWIIYVENSVNHFSTLSAAQIDSSIHYIQHNFRLKFIHDGTFLPVWYVHQHGDFPLEIMLSCSVNLNLFERVEIYTSLLLQSKVEPRVCLEHSSRICNRCKQIRFSIRFYFMEIFGRWIWNFKKTASKIKVAVIFFGIFFSWKCRAIKLNRNNCNECSLFNVHIGCVIHIA